MKNSIFTAVIFLFITFDVNAQNQLSLSSDSTNTGKLGFKNQYRWPLTLKNFSEKIDLKFQKLSEAKINENNSGWTMAIYEPKTNHSMPIHVPDSTINHSLLIVQPENN